jgi:cobalt/nickel transport protein
MKKEMIITIAAFSFLCTSLAFIFSYSAPEGSGSDDKAVNLIDDLTGGSYQPWFKCYWTPSSSDMKNILFSLQAALGGLVIGYFFSLGRRD